MLNKEIQNIDKLINKYKNKKIFLITGKNTISFLEKKKFKLKLNKLKLLKFYFKTESVPQLRELKKIIIECKKFDPEVIIGLGGGTVIDYSKLCRFFLNEKEILINIEKIKKKNNSLKKLICIPTTCGSGAESTTFSVLYKRDKKFSLNNKFMMPDFYCLIPDYITGMKKKIATPPALDVFAQTIESIMSLRSNKKSINFSYKSLQILNKHLFNYINSRSLSSTRKMTKAANLAGRAINISKTTGPHALSYIFTTKYGIPHGRAVLMSLKHFLKINYLEINKDKSLKNKFKKIFYIMKIKNFDEFENFIDRLSKTYFVDLKKIQREISFNPNLFIRSVNLERLKNNPIKIDNGKLKEIINSI